MALAIGTRIGPYEVIGLVGTGGMGEVYRARDTKLDREVAIKVLLPALANDGHRLARFNREAKVLGSLNHPNIAHVHGFEDATDVCALVMEFIDGPTLADRLRFGAIPLDEALSLAKQIAEALEAAHAQGIIHRDLKPANIKVRPDGVVKVLDFGLAKTLDTASPAIAEDADTLSMQRTAAGAILGTAAYMSPEQARGNAVDQRADIWAFGCVLFEMLTGTRAFKGEDTVDTMLAVVSKEPDWSVFPATAFRLRPLVAWCLAKNVKQRLQAVGDARIQIEQLISGSDATVAFAPAATAARSMRSASIFALGAAAAAALVTWSLLTPQPKNDTLPSRFQIVPPPELAIQVIDRDLAISPDGRYITYRGGGLPQLVVRAIDDLETRPLAGTSNARQPFFSPDSRWIGFFDGESLKKVSIEGGSAITICQTPLGPRGASWGNDDSIVFGAGLTNGLLRVPAGGGEPIALTKPEAAQSEMGHWYPSVLPDGRGVLFTIAESGLAERMVAVLDLKTLRYKILIRGGTQPEYTPSGHLLYATAGTLRAVRFDLERLEVVSSPVPVVEDVWISLGGAAGYSVSKPGTLVYVPAATAVRPRSLVWVDRKGRETPIRAPLRLYEEPRLSPDDTRIALAIRDQQIDISVFDLARETLTRLTYDPGTDQHPIWTSDGRRIVFASLRARSDAFNLFMQAADGSGPVERLTAGAASQYASFIEQNMSSVVGSEFSPTTAGDVVRIPLTGFTQRSVQQSEPMPSDPLVSSKFNELNPEVSPDGRFIAYQSNESGRNEIYVRPFPRINDGRWQASTNGGTRPVWARDGSELFYLDLANILTSVMAKTSAGTFTPTRPSTVFNTSYAAPLNSHRTYDVSLDGQRFLMIKEAPEGQDARRAGMVVVLNWFEALKAALSPQ